QAYELLRDRRLLGVDVAIFADVQGKHAVPLAPIEIEQQARDLASRSLADGLVVSGRATGDATPIDDLKRVRSAVPDVPILVGSDGTTLKDNAHLESLLCETRVAGVILFARNIVDAEQTARLTHEISARARACTGRALLVAVDAEGGRVMRLGPGAGWTPTLS